MRSPHNFIVYCEERYNNKVDVDGKELIVNTDISEKDFMFTNRIGVVVNTPSFDNSPIEVGDEIIVHHNAFRRYHDVKGNEKDTAAFLHDNHFIISHDQIFGYKQNGEWKATPGFVFIKPLPPESIWSTTGESFLKGELYYTSPALEHLRGHVVGYTPDSEYEFNIDGERLFRVFEHHVTIDYNGRKERETKDNKISAGCLEGA